MLYTSIMRSALMYLRNVSFFKCYLTLPTLQFNIVLRIWKIPVQERILFLLKIIKLRTQSLILIMIYLGFTQKVRRKRSIFKMMIIRKRSYYMIFISHKYVRIILMKMSLAKILISYRLISASLRSNWKLFT